jgi:hypothetical protein
MLQARGSSAFDAAGSGDPAVAFRGYARVTIQGVRVTKMPSLIWLFPLSDAGR